jgi:hypothetical protein
MNLMRGYNWLKLLGILLIASGGGGVRAELVTSSNPGMEASTLSVDELAAPIAFELILEPYPFDLRRKQTLGGTMGIVDVRSSYGEVVSWLKGLGFTVLDTDPNCVRIELRGSRRQLADALQISFVRQSELNKSVIVPVSGRSLPYRPTGSVLSIESLVMDLPTSFAASDRSLGVLRDQEASERRLAGLYPGS